MTDERAELQVSIERTQEALAEKAHEIEHRVVEAKERVTHALDMPSQYREGPWPFLFTAVFAGLVTGACWSARSSARHALGDHQRVELLD